MSFYTKATEDKRVKYLLKLIKKGKYNIDIVSLDIEIDKLHSQRLIRKLKTTELVQSFQRKFTDAALQNQAYRSRLIAIKIRLYRISADLEEHISAISGYLKTKYPNSLAEYKTQADRKAAIEHVLEKPLKLLSELQKMDIVLEIVVKDIDQASWCLKSISEAFEINNVDKSSKF